MFERTKFFWHRLVGSPCGQTTLENMGKERRSSIRFAGNREIIYRPAQEERGEKNFCAQLDNVSSGGIRLIVDQKFQPGDLLSIQLPTESADSFTWVLACVVHVNKEEGHGWGLGCNFSRELSAEDLQAFGATPNLGPNIKEKRSAPRILCELEASFQMVGEGCSPAQKARLENISSNGLALAVAELIPVGALLNVELHSRVGGTAKNLLCCAVHVTQHRPGEWVVGCNFMVDMEDEDFNALLSQ